uniref:Uncharacterized protein n=1 Tax=Balaenoptera musculus TaxID=9771 RepID=A0A8C0DCN1_BALMU
MGRKLDPTKKEKARAGPKGRKQKGAETELARFLPAAPEMNKSPGANHCLESYQKVSGIGELSRHPVRREPRPYLTVLEARSAQHQPIAVTRKREEEDSEGDGV